MASPVCQCLRRDGTATDIRAGVLRYTDRIVAIQSDGRRVVSRRLQGKVHAARSALRRRRHVVGKALDAA